MDSDASHPTNQTFTVTFDFSEDVTGFDIDDITVTGGRTVSDVRRSTDQIYTVDVKPNTDFDGSVTVRIRANAVRSTRTQDGNAADSESFAVDTRAPELETATVDEDELVLTYDEDLDENSEPSPSRFTVEVDGDAVTISKVDIRGEDVTVTLDDAVSGGDDVTIDYDPRTNPIQDELGNEALSLTNKTVRNITADDVPSAPSDLTATADGRTRIDLEWDAPSDIGGSRITGYRIAVSNTGTGNWTDLERDTDDTRTTYTHSDLEPGTRQYYRVAAINREGDEGPWSSIANATTEGGTPSEPRNLTAVESGSSRINLSWSAPISNGGSRITGYKIEVSSNGGRTWSVRVSDTRSSSTTYAHRGLESGTTWHYRVSAINSEGPGEPSNVASATTDIGAPRAPTSLSAVSSGESQIRLSWAPPSDDGGARIVGYRIDVSTTGGSSWTVLSGNTGSISTSYTHRNLPPGSTRSYRVAAINSQGRGAYSNTATATTRAAVPDAPTNLTATASGRTQINLRWRAPLVDGGARITGYRVEVSLTGGSPWTVLTSRAHLHHIHAPGPVPRHDPALPRVRDQLGGDRRRIERRHRHHGRHRSECSRPALCQGERAESDRPDLDRAHQRRRGSCHGVPDRVLAQWCLLDPSAEQHGFERHLLLEHRIGAGYEAVLPGVRDQHCREEPGVECRQRHDRRDRSRCTHQPFGRRKRDIADRSVVASSIL